MRLNTDCLIIVADGKAANFLQNQDAGGTQARGCRNVALVAEPRALGVLRKALPPELRDASVLELAKDHTKTATGDLAKILAIHPA